jgi:hypothetical protein
MAIDPKKKIVKVLKKVDPEKKSETKNVKDKDGGNSIRTTTTTNTPGTPDSIIKGTPSTTTKGKPGSAAVLATKGVNSTDLKRNKAFGDAKRAGLETFKYEGKTYNTKMSGTKGKPAVPQTPDVVTPGTPDRVIKGTPPSSNTVVSEKKIPSEVYTVNAKRGTIGGAKRDGIGGSVTTGSQVTSSKEMADRAIKAQSNFNADVNKKYAPDTANERGLNPAQLKLKNEKAEQRRKDLQGTTGVSLTPVQSGLERKKVEAMRKK